MGYANAKPKTIKTLLSKKKELGNISQQRLVTHCELYIGIYTITLGIDQLAWATVANMPSGH